MAKRRLSKAVESLGRTTEHFDKLRMQLDLVQAITQVAHHGQQLLEAMPAVGAAGLRAHVVVERVPAMSRKELERHLAEAIRVRDAVWAALRAVSQLGGMFQEAQPGCVGAPGSETRQ
jgi:hypothetical protein